MKLFYREYGQDKPPLVILHGLYGASDNWVSIARQLEKDFHIFLVDQRNHGHSPHSNEHDFDCMANDLHEFLTDHNINKAYLLGHSMGGKTVMRFALDHPEMISKLIVLDIAPKSYASFSNFAQITNNHALIIDSMLNVDFSNVKSRSDIDVQLSKNLDDIKLRQFLLKNIERTKSGNYQWRLNLTVIKDRLEAIMDGFSALTPEQNHINIDSIFIRGEKSGYVMEEDTLIMRKYFKNAELVTIPNAGHWLHAEQPELFIKTLRYFLLD